MKIFVMVLLILVASQARAEDCKVREYAQLKEMEVKDLEFNLTNYTALWDIYLKSNKAYYDKGYSPPKSSTEISDRCYKEIEKIEQVLKSKRSVEKAAKQERDYTQSQNGSQSREDAQAQERTSSSGTEIYRSTDSNGTMVFTDNPTTIEEPKKQKKVKKIQY